MEQTRSYTATCGFIALGCIVVTFGLLCIGGIVISPIVYAQVKRNAQIDAAKTQIRIFETGLESYRLDTGGYPSPRVGMKALLLQPPGVPHEKWRGPYIAKEELDEEDDLFCRKPCIS